jgi:hypothetical protein
MSDLTPQKQIGGTAIHVGDCRVWAEIYYLDSPTDYREFLPCNEPRPVPARELVLLDDMTPFPRIIFGWCLGALIFACVILSLNALVPFF